MDGYGKIILKTFTEENLMKKAKNGQYSSGLKNSFLLWLKYLKIQTYIPTFPEFCRRLTVIL